MIINVPINYNIFIFILFYFLFFLIYFILFYFLIYFFCVPFVFVPMYAWSHNCSSIGSPQPIYYLSIYLSLTLAACKPNRINRVKLIPQKPLSQIPTKPSCHELGTVINKICSISTHLPFPLCPKQVLPCTVSWSRSLFVFMFVFAKPQSWLGIGCTLTIHCYLNQIEMNVFLMNHVGLKGLRFSMKST